MNIKILHIFSKLIIVLITVSVLLIGLIYLLVPPKLILKGNSNVEIEYSNKYVEEGYSAVFAGKDVSSYVEISSNINYNKLGSYEIKYVVKDKLGILKNVKKRKVTIVDTEPPKIKLNDNDKLLYLGEEYKEPGFTAVDNYDGNITNKVEIENNIDNKTEGTYEVKYRVLDSANNENIVIRNVTVSSNNVDSIPIFTYHGFMSDEEKNKYATNDKYTMSVSSFEEQLKYLKENGYNTITLDDFYKWYTNQIALTEKDVLIVMDDGHLSQYKYAIPLVEKYGFTATIFVITGRIKNEDQIWDPSINKYFSDYIIKDIKENHRTIYLASHTHYLHSTINGSCAMLSKTQDEIYNDIVMSKDIIDSEYLAYPFGCHTNASNEALKKANYKMAFDFSADARATKNDNIYEIKRININADTTMQKFRKWLEV